MGTFSGKESYIGQSPGGNRVSKEAFLTSRSFAEGAWLEFTQMIHHLKLRNYPVLPTAATFRARSSIPVEEDSMDRREFVKRCMVTGAGIIVAPSLTESFQKIGQTTPYEICSVTGDRYFDNAIKAVDALGGMGRFVHSGNTVGILVNSPWSNRGSITNPDIALAVVKMCQDAGAKQIVALNDISQKYWKRSGLYEAMKSDLDRVRYADGMTEVTIDKGKSLKRAEVAASLLSCDVYINVPVIKDHEGVRFTCALKNTMGACSGSTCRRFHFGEGSVLTGVLKGYYSNPELLSQSIADINLVRQPDLCVVDATEILATNGPSGPGEVRRPREVFAATNCVAADMYATRHLGLHWEDLPVIRFAQQHGYGPKSLQEIVIRTL